MDDKKIKKELLTDDLIKMTAPSGYHFENIDGQNLGNIVYDSINVRFRQYYILEEDTKDENNG